MGARPPTPVPGWCLCAAGAGAWPVLPDTGRPLQVSETGPCLPPQAGAGPSTLKQQPLALANWLCRGEGRVPWSGSLTSGLGAKSSLCRGGLWIAQLGRICRGSRAQAGPQLCSPFPAGLAQRAPRSAPTPFLGPFVFCVGFLSCPLPPPAQHRLVLIRAFRPLLRARPRGEPVWGLPDQGWGPPRHGALVLRPPQPGTARVCTCVQGPGQK